MGNIQGLPPWAELKKAIIQSALHNHPKMRLWFDDFFSGDEATLRKVITETLSYDPQGGLWLVVEVLWNCFKANTFNDPDKARRTLASDFIADRQRARPAIKQLRRLIKQYPDQVGLVIARANLMEKTADSTGETHVPLSMKPRIPLVRVLDDFLASLDDSFQQTIPGVRCGTYLHRYRSGPLLYSNPLDLNNSQGDAALNGLLFVLAFNFRRATNGQQGTSWNNGEPMPRSGKPCIALIAQYAWLVFPDRENDITTDKIADRLKRLGKCASLTQWPE